MMAKKEHYRNVPYVPYQETADRFDYVYKGQMIRLYGLTDIIVDYFFQALIGVDAVEKKISIQKIIVSKKR